MEVTDIIKAFPVDMCIIERRDSDGVGLRARERVSFSLRIV
jgi:hypothetical protein